jgi:hypothetical protein
VCLLHSFVKKARSFFNSCLVTVINNEHLLSLLSNSLGDGTAPWCSAGLGDGISGVRITSGGWEFSLYHHVQTGSGAHTASYTMGTRALSLVVRWSALEAEHSPPSSAVT